jgi:hypothetical protein
MKEGIISYRFKSEKNQETIKFPGEHISVGDLKRKIEEKRMSTCG